jgi:biotin synthase-like enzyme
MESKKLLKRIDKFEKDIESVKNYLNFDFVLTLGVLPENILEFIKSLDMIKDKLRANEYSKRDISTIKLVLSEVELYIYNKFAGYF